MTKEEYENIKTRLLYTKCPRCFKDETTPDDAELCFYHAKIHAGLIDEPEVELTYEECQMAPGYLTGYSSLGTVWTYADHFSGNNDAFKSELFSEGLTHLMNAILSWKPDKDANFNTFASTVIKNGLISYLRKENRWSVEMNLDDFEEATEESQEDSIMRKEEHDKFWTVMDGLFPNLEELERAVLLMRIMPVKKEPLRQLGERFETSRMTVLRIEAKLRKIIREEMENGIF